MAEESYYELLQVTPTADLEIITGAYRALIRRHHPDRNPSPTAEATTKLLNEAWEILSDPAKRAEYDRELAAGSPVRPVPPTPPPNRPTQETPPPRPEPPPPRASQPEPTKADWLRSKQRVYLGLMGVVFIFVVVILGLGVLLGE